ncbi:type II toxin-antitoxin system RelE/ParE family toxin [Longimicrobium sp.]|uniref:type II toxin-antitoxin system RelE/ParE family toxin n=1 Tax=Longimicrobium sp. TaxID=2029185 RepID=UPI002B82C2FA|nr:type II toxin-antitoxin system RelE/ParE family toxin [Longimicrobium sp.]HSU13680.1 type II toxin-antitoxin system RelE/ParE family toxin [Longimicrobium sp.]
MYRDSQPQPVPAKPLRWVGAAYRELVGFTDEARRAAGYNLKLVQQGVMPEDWKPMEAVGLGTYELRIATGASGSVQHRVLYVAKFEEAVYVLHAFEKKARTTPQHDLEIGRARYAEMLRIRRERSRSSEGR